jgi:hypothetical protein
MEIDTNWYKENCDSRMELEEFLDMNKKIERSENASLQTYVVENWNGNRYKLKKNHYFGRRNSKEVRGRGMLGVRFHDPRILLYFNDLILVNDFIMMPNLLEFKEEGTS